MRHSLVEIGSCWLVNCCFQMVVFVLKQSIFSPGNDPVICICICICSIISLKNNVLNKKSRLLVQPGV